MRRISTATRVVDKFGAGKDGFTNGDVVGGIPATDLEDVLFDHLQEELANTVELAGIALSAASRTQVAQAIRRMFGGNVTTLNFAVSPLAITADMAGLILVDATGGNVVGNLPAVNVIAQALKYRFIRIDATGNTATFNRAGADTFLGATTSFTLTGQGDYRNIEGDTTSKWITTSVKASVAPLGAVVARFSNLALSATGTSAPVTITADEISVEDSSNNYMTVRAVNMTASGAVAGIGGLDTGSLAASTWYYVFVVVKPDGTKGAILSLSSTAPTMPSGYTFKARVGAIRTDASGNKYPLSFTQAGSNVQYKRAAASNVTAYPTIISGTQGDVTTPTWVAASISSFVPPSASRVKVSLSTIGMTCIAAPNNSPSGYNAGASAPPLFCNSNVSATDIWNIESTNVYYASNGTTAWLTCTGWEDSI